MLEQSLYADRLDQVLINDKIDQRPTRLPDFASEQNALLRYTQAMSETPAQTLQQLVQAVLKLTGAGSAGVSVLEYDQDEPVFRWHATAGVIGSNTDCVLPRDQSPCGVTLQRNAPQLMQRPGRVFKVVEHADPAIVETLMVPFHLDGEPAGTLWVIAHDEARVFDAEDQRLLTSLARFVPAALRLAEKGKADRTAAAPVPADDTICRLAEQRRLALDAARVGWWQRDPGTGLFYIDERYADILGIDARPRPMEELLACVHPEDRQRIDLAIKAATRGQDPRPYDVEYRVVRPGGKIRWVAAKGQATFEVVGYVRQYTAFVGTLFDITESRAVRDALHASEQRFRQLADAMPAMVWVTDGDGILQEHNRQWAAYVGTASPTPDGQRWFDAMHLDDVQTVYALWRTAVRYGDAFDYQCPVRRVSDGALRWHHHRATPYRDADGTIVRWIGSSTDIHDCKLLAAANAQAPV